MDNNQPIWYGMRRWPMTLYCPQNPWYEAMFSNNSEMTTTEISLYVVFSNILFTRLILVCGIQR